MKKIFGILAIATLALSVSSCDFFRALAGRPTSAQFTQDTTCACCGAADTLSADTCCASADTCCASADTCCTSADSAAVADSCSICSDCKSCEGCEQTKDSCCTSEPVECEKKDTCTKAEPVCSEAQETVEPAAAEPLAAEPAAEPAPAEPAAEPVAAEPQAVEEKIISNIGQKTGFLKVSVSYNNVKLLNSVESGYYILIGTFRQKANADRLAKQAEKAGQEVTRLEYANGRTSIALRRSDNLSDAFVALGEVRKLSFSPKDACILVVE